MRRSFLAVSMVLFCSLCFAQQSLSNDAIVKMVKAGLSDDLIVTTISSQAGTYDTSTDGIIALKAPGISDKIVAAIVQKSSAVPPTSNVSGPNASGAPSSADGTTKTAPEPAPAQRANLPRVYLQSASKGSQWNAVRDQSMEMSKDFEKDCPGVKVTINQNAAD